MRRSSLTSWKFDIPAMAFGLALGAVATVPALAAGDGGNSAAMNEPTLKSPAGTRCRASPPRSGLGEVDPAGVVDEAEIGAVRGLEIISIL